MSKIILGFSGGVDSAVCAVLLKKQGFDVCGVYLDNADENARNDAVDAAEFIGIPLTVLDVKEELEEKVCKPFCNSYLNGETPNPCIICNPTMKFKNLIAEADKTGAELIATGHYARTENGRLLRGMPSNDQSYMLCRLTREQVRRTVFPLGGFEKAQVREMALDFCLPVAKKPDSMEICFIPDKDYIGWISRRAPLPPPGDFVFHGEVIGRHEGIHTYTVGQRRPGLYNGRKLYVSRIDAKTNTIELALWEELFTTELKARDFSWLIDAPSSPVFGQVRVRHTKWEIPDCTAVCEADGNVSFSCRSLVRAPATGQSAVLYDGEYVLGGGFIIP